MEKTMTTKLESFANAICRTVMKESRNGRWDSAVEQALHRHGYRSGLNPHVVSQVIEPGLKNYPALALGFFNWTAQQSGYSHNTASYQALIKSLQLAKQFKTLDKILKQMKLDRVQMNPSIYASVIQSLLQNKKILLAYQTLMEMRANFGTRIRSDICNAMLSSLSSSGHMDLACKMYAQMRSDGVQVGFISFGVFTAAFSRSGEMTKILDLVDDGRHVISIFKGSVISSLVVNGLCRESRVEEACWVLEELRARDCMPDFIAYCFVIEALREKHCPDEAHKLMRQKRRFSVAPRLHAYQEFIFALVKDKRMREAHEVANLIRIARFCLGEGVYNVLIGALSCSDPQAALSFLCEMMEAGFQPNGLTICNLVRGLSNSDKIDEVFQAFEALQLRGVVVDLLTYNTIIFCLCKSGKVMEAYRVLEGIRKNDMKPDVQAYNAVMDACCKADLWRPAKRLWDEMFREGCDPNTHTYNILISTFLKIGNAVDAENLYKNMLLKGIAPDLVTYRMLIYGLTNENRIDEAYKIYADYIRSGLQQSISIPQEVQEALKKSTDACFPANAGLFANADITN